MSPVLDTGDSDYRKIEELCTRIQNSLHRFDPISLLRVLERAGVDVDSIEYRSHHSTASQNRLIERVEASPAGIVLIFNLGLLSAQSPLPSYFFRQMDQGEVSRDSFEHFIGMFDHALIKLYLQSIYPELNTYLFTDWAATCRRQLSLQNLRSVGGIHWLFKMVFPEFRVFVQKKMMSREIAMPSLRLGHFMLGDDAVFGEATNLGVLGLRVSLSINDDVDGAGQPWFKIIEQRLTDYIHPILDRVGVDLELMLVIHGKESAASLEASTHLGYDRLQGGSSETRRILIFRGQFCA